MTTNISNTDDMIDSRDLEEYIDDMRDEVSSAELQPVLDFAAEFRDYAEDYEYGEVAIHDMHFVEYCRELVYDCGYLPDELPWWIESNIDWSGVADELKHEYSAIEFNGETYWTRQNVPTIEREIQP